MKAVQIFKYNKQDIRAELVEVVKPVIQADEVLVCQGSRREPAGCIKITRGGIITYTASATPNDGT